MILLAACGSSGDEGATESTIDLSEGSTAFVVRPPETTVAPETTPAVDGAVSTAAQDYTIQSGDYPLKVANQFGVTVDELVAYKNKTAVIPFAERLEIVRSIEYVDAAIPQYDMDKFEMWNKLSFDVMFVGDDWYRSDKWSQLQEKFAEVGVDVVYFPYTPGTSSTIINQTLTELRSEGSDASGD